MVPANTEENRIELIGPAEEQTIYADFIAAQRCGINLVGILVDDLRSAIWRAESAGLRVIKYGSGFSLDGDGYFACLDSEEVLGLTIELLARPKHR